MVRTATRELIWIIRDGNTLRVNARVLTDDGTIITSVENGKFYVNRNETYRPGERPDESTLVVFDQKGNQVLKSRFANSQSFEINGVFHDGTKQKMIVTPDSIDLIALLAGGDDTKTKDSCFIDPGDAGRQTPVTQFGRFYIGGPLLTTGDTTD